MRKQVLVILIVFLFAILAAQPVMSVADLKKEAQRVMSMLNMTWVRVISWAKAWQ